MPDFEFETLAKTEGYSYIAGVDEVGRGPLAGPVTASAVVLFGQVPVGLDDSKSLSLKRREALYPQIIEHCDVGIGHASVDEIDELNILQASFLAMKRAIAALSTQPDFALIDGNRLPANLSCPARPIVKGDAKSLSIAAASIVAKVCRDRIMVDLAQQYPAYDWQKNAGYPTAHHLEVIQREGITPHHRRSFKPIRNILYQEKNSK